jgi:hypothetical protein
MILQFTIKKYFYLRLNQTKYTDFNRE